MKQDIKAAYIHIPFCRQKCSYCDFISFPKCRDDLIEDYISTLRAEILAAAKWASSSDGPGIAAFSSIFIGGGTPSILKPDHIRDIMGTISDNFPLEPDGEFTIEANPGTVDETSIYAYREAGLNRISFGLQAVRPSLLKLLGRIHSADDFADSVSLAHAAGFKSINADIMFGLPGQTLQDVKLCLDQVFRLPVNHLSFYSLSLEENTPLYELCLGGKVVMPDEELDRQQYHYIRGRLPDEGFSQYEISNAAMDGYMCRHNLVYWKALPYYGFGLAAHSYIQNRRRANTDNLAEYIAKSGRTGNKPADYPAGEILEITDKQSRMREMMILGMRLTAGVSYEEFKQRFDSDLRLEFPAELESLSAKGLIDIGDKAVRLTEQGMDMANLVFGAFV